jgi:transketolase
MRTYAELPALMTAMTGDEKHGPSATSTLDVLWVLYDQVLRVSPDRLDDPGRDRFLLSKGHGPAAYYAVLAAKGFIPESWLAGFGSAGSALGYHPDRNLVPGVEIASGSLGHGLPLGVGLAHGLLARGLLSPRVFMLVGDAELNEGSNNEAIVYAGAVGLANLCVAVGDMDVTVAYATSVRPFDGEGCFRWLRPLRLFRWCWWSRTWPGRRRTACLWRWRGGRTGCSAWVWGVRSGGGTARRPTTRRCTGWTRPGSGIRSVPSWPNEACPVPVAGP